MIHFHLDHVVASLQDRHVTRRRFYYYYSIRLSRNKHVFHHVFDVMAEEVGNPTNVLCVCRRRNSRVLVV